jgi:hypothetical protein
VSAGAFSHTFQFISNWLVPQLTVSLRASPSSGPADLGTVLTATVGGSAQGPINYTFWWNCASSDTNVANVMAVCGSIAATCTNTGVGNKCDSSNDNPKVVVTDYPQPGTYTAKVIVERGGAMPSEARVQITVTPCDHLSLVSSPPGGGTAVANTPNNCSGGYLPGTQVSLSATPAAGYSFSTWTASSGSLGSATAPTTTFTISADATVTANFTAIPTCNTLVTNVQPFGAGTVSVLTPSNCPGGYFNGSSISLTAVASGQAAFSSWTGTGGSFADPSQAQTTFTITGNATVNGNFVPVSTCYTLVASVQPAAAGSVSILTPSNCSGGYLSGTNISLSAVALGQAAFSGWTASGGTFSDSSTPQTTFTITANAVVTALFGASGLQFFTVSPCRAIDTRNSPGPLGGPSLAGSTIRYFTVAGTCGIPMSARAISVNVTAVVPAADGFLVLFPGDQPVPESSNLNFRAGQVRANNAIVGLASNGSGTIAVENALPGPVDVLLDINGYWQ